MKLNLSLVDTGHTGGKLRYIISGNKYSDRPDRWLQGYRDTAKNFHRREPRRGKAKRAHTRKRLSARKQTETTPTVPVGHCIQTVMITAF